MHKRNEDFTVKGLKGIDQGIFAKGSRAMCCGGGSPPMGSMGKAPVRGPGARS